jgi:hypothetical protein
VDWATAASWDLTLQGSRTLGNPTNVVAGQSRIIHVVGNNGTQRTLSFGSNYENVPTIADITNAKRYTVTLIAQSTTSIVVAAVGYAI